MIKLFEKYKDISDICDKYDIENWTINGDKVDVDGGVDLSEMGISKLPLKFGRVTGDFLICDNQLTSLEGAPKQVSGYFDCKYNKLTSLKGVPKEIGGSFYCDDNELTSLEGGPESVLGDFFCSYNILTSLEGAPKEVGGDFYCNNNKLTSLKGAPEWIGRDFHCSNNKLTSLFGAPKVNGSFYCYHNYSLPKEIIDNINYINRIIKYQNDYSIWKSDGTLDKWRLNDMMEEIKEKNEKLDS